MKSDVGMYSLLRRRKKTVMPDTKKNSYAGEKERERKGRKRKREKPAIHRPSTKRKPQSGNQSTIIT